nr:MAG TPA: Bacterial DNA-binding protein [Caudoviricetes sp.]
MITKADIVDDIFIMQENGLTKKEIAAVVDGMLQAIRNQVAVGNSIQFRDYFTISPVLKKAKKAHDFKNGTTITMPRRPGVKIRASKGFEDYVKRVNNLG